MKDKFNYKVNNNIEHIETRSFNSDYNSYIIKFKEPITALTYSINGREEAICKNTEEFKQLIIKKLGELIFNIIYIK